MADRTRVGQILPPRDDDYEDTLAVMRQEVDQHIEMARDTMKILASEFLALCNEGVPSREAAYIIGLRYRIGGT